MKRWTCGMTTIPSRIKEGATSSTLLSLKASGFDEIRLFIDGGFPDLANLQTVRDPKVGAFGNWYLGMAELYVRNPLCHYYAMFQDDLILCRGVRAYLERCRYPDGNDGREKGYWNLFTFRNSENEIEGRKPVGWRQGAIMVNDPTQRLQCGRGALAYVFSREAVQDLLSSYPLVQKPASSHFPTLNIDGAVVNAMNLQGWREYVHGPSLVQHTGKQSSLSGKVWENYANSFIGEDWDVNEGMGGV